MTRLVSQARAHVKRIPDGLVISATEYTPGLPGVLKNASDWLVGGCEFINKPVVFFNASSRSTLSSLRCQNGTIWPLG
jgi:chromate reductase, NAD(P)H dehydrogenase (quinone)